MRPDLKSCGKPSSNHWKTIRIGGDQYNSQIDLWGAGPDQNWPVRKIVERELLVQQMFKFWYFKKKSLRDENPWYWCLRIPMMLYTSQLQACCYPVSFQFCSSRCNIGLQISICIINSDALFWIFNRFTINCQTELIKTPKYVSKRYLLMHVKFWKNVCTFQLEQPEKNSFAQ